MAHIWNWTWLTVAFLSELAALAALALWGWSTGGSTVSKVVLALVATGHPRLAAVLALAAVLSSFLSTPPAEVPAVAPQ